jgi:hypothetical protein
MLPVEFTSHLPPGRGSVQQQQPAAVVLLVSKGVHCIVEDEKEEEQR